MTQVTLFKNTKYKPVFLLIANIHGDETIGREISLYLMNYLCVEYNRNPDIKKIVDNFRIYIFLKVIEDELGNLSRKSKREKETDGP